MPVGCERLLIGIRRNLGQQPIVDGADHRAGHDAERLSHRLGSAEESRRTVDIALEPGEGNETGEAIRARVPVVQLEAPGERLLEQESWPLPPAGVELSKAELGGRHGIELDVTELASDRQLYSSNVERLCQRHRFFLSPACLLRPAEPIENIPRWDREKMCWAATFAVPLDRGLTTFQTRYESRNPFEQAEPAGPRSHLSKGMEPARRAVPPSAGRTEGRERLRSALPDV